MSLAKLLIAGIALAASTSALASDDNGGWSSQNSSYQGSSYQSYERSGGYSEQTYDVSGAWARAHRGDAHEDHSHQASGGHYGYAGLREEGNARAYRSSEHSDVRGASWSYSEQGAGFAPPCRHLNDRVPAGWQPLPVCPDEGELTIDNGFFLGDGGGVGGFPDYDGGGGGGGGYAMVGGSAGAGAHAFASARASASASVSIRFRGGFHGHGGGGHHGGHKGGGCGCGK